MEATINKWGNSLAVRLPRQIAEQVRLVEGSKVDLLVDDGALRIVPTRKKLKLSELLEGEPHKYGEVDWGPARGGEEW